jgi:hypothetical protein
MLELMTKKFHPMIGTVINKNLKNKIYASFFNKFSNNNISTRNYYQLKYFSYLIKNKYIKKEVEKKKKITNYRIIKKLKTFRFFTGRGQTKAQVFRKFKRNVIKKFIRKVGLKKKTIY